MTSCEAPSDPDVSYQQVSEIDSSRLGKLVKEKDLPFVAAFKDIDFDGFQKLTTEISDYRREHLVYLEDFQKMMKRKDVFLLDARSKRAYDQIHIKGATHLNFSDFTEDKLAQIIPDKNAKILIYCNNNFNSTSTALGGKAPPLALNIPTYINLYGYGYKNVYELYTPERLNPKDCSLKFEGLIAKSL